MCKSIATELRWRQTTFAPDHGTKLGRLGVKGRQPVYVALTEHCKEFEAWNGSVVCRDLLGFDPTTPEGAQLAKERGLFKTTYLKMVRDADEIFDGMLSK